MHNELKNYFPRVNDPLPRQDSLSHWPLGLALGLVLITLFINGLNGRLKIIQVSWMTGERTARKEMEVQALRQSHGTAPEEAPLPYFFSWAILNLTHPIKQPYTTNAVARRKKEVVLTLISLTRGVNHCFSRSRERLHRDCRFLTLSTVVLRQKKTADRLQNNRNDRKLRNHQEMLKN